MVFRKENIIYLIYSLVFIIYPQVSFASSQCSKTGYTILTINGVFTNESGANNNKTQLARNFGITWNNQEVTYQYILNPSHGAGIGDIIDSVGQGLFDEQIDYDLVNMLNDTSQKLTTQKVLLVAHSQGNFYANSIYKKITDVPGGVPSQSIGVYGVANPAKSVGGGGKYLTSDTDKVIAKVVGRTIGVLTPNTHIELGPSDDYLGHNFSNVYLKYKSDQIVLDIRSSLDRLKSNDVQDPSQTCIDPPEITLGHKIEGLGIYIADSIANGGVYVASRTIRGVYNVGLAINNSIDRTVLAIAGFGKSLFATAFFAEQNNLNPNVAQNLLAKELPESTPVDTTPVVDTPTVYPKPIVVATTLPQVVLDTVSTSPLVNNSVSTVSGGVAHGKNNVVNTVNQITPNQSPGGDGTGQAPFPKGGDSTPPTPSTPDPVPQVVDVLAPAITLNGAPRYEIAINSTFTDPGATALDGVDGVVQVVATGTVDSATLGTYVLTYTATDTAGNTSTATRTIIVEPRLGRQTNFDRNNKVYITSTYGVCDIANKVVYLYGSNMGVTNFVSSTNWHTNSMASGNTDMIPNINYRFIFADYAFADIDCANDTHINDFSNTLHYTSALGSSVMYDPNSITTIYSFVFNGPSPSVVGVIKEPANTIKMVVPTSTDLTSLVPTIIIAPGATVIPASGQAQDFTNPVIYKVTSLDGSTLEYTVSIIPKGNIFIFDPDNKIYFSQTGTGMVSFCNVDSRTIESTSNFSGSSSLLSSTNWQTAGMISPNTSMTPNVNYRFIFGDSTRAESDCADGTYISDSSNSFYYATNMGDSIVYLP
ncbi:MAG: immunoglobulin-like domain-containing protein [bacterium]